MINAINITKYFDSFKAIEDISFHVEKGEIVGFIGPNGSGKTTTMRILTCFMPPTKGTAIVAGHDILKESLEVRRHVGYFPEGAPYYPSLSVYKYLEFVAQVKGIDNSIRKKRLNEVMELCGIINVSDRYVENLSKGYRQRVCLAQAILNDPDVLILDEPTVGLDPRQVIEVRNLIKELSGHRTVILSSHILSEISMICDRVLIIDKGRLVAQDSIENLSKKAEKEKRLLIVVKAPREKMEAFLRDMGLDIISVEPENYGEESIDRYVIEIEANNDLRDEISKRIISNNWKLFEIGFKGLTLEDIYLKLISGQR